MITEHDGIFTVRNYIAKNTLKIISQFVQPRLAQDPNNQYVKGALGFLTQDAARLMSLTNPIIPLGDSSSDETSMLITKIVLDIKSLIEQIHNRKIELIQLTYNALATGGSNSIHVDMATGMYNGLEYAALLYVGEYGKDYQGGEIVFPLQNKVFTPGAGTLLFFIGDEARPHGVNPVLSGVRENIIMFFRTEE